MALALPNVTGDTFSLNDEILAAGKQAARESDRKRMILPLHRQQSASVQRMLNFFQPGTYVRPHNHPEDGAIETICVLCGALGFVVYDTEGTALSAHRLSPGSSGVIDIEPGVWHGMVALEPDTVILEIKQGPYDPHADKSFANWAPDEGAVEAEKCVRDMEKLFN